MASSALLRCCYRSELPLSLTDELSPQPLLPLSWCGAAHQGRQGQCRHLPWVVVQAVVIQLQTEIKTAACESASSDCPNPTKLPFWVWAVFLSHIWALSSSMAAFAPVWSWVVKQAEIKRSLSSGWDVHKGGGRKPASHSCSHNLPYLPCFRDKQVCMPSSWLEFRLPTALLLVPPAIQSSKETHLPGVRPQGRSIILCGSNCSHLREDLHPPV